jgi:hypothetical protein
MQPFLADLYRKLVAASSACVHRRQYQYWSCYHYHLHHYSCARLQCFYPVPAAIVFPAHSSLQLPSLTPPQSLCPLSLPEPPVHPPQPLLPNPPPPPMNRNLAATAAADSVAEYAAADSAAVYPNESEKRWENSFSL